MASSPITAWQIEGKKVEVVTDFLFLGSKITTNGNCSHEIRRHLLLGRKAMTNLDGVLKSKVHIVKAVVFPVVMYSCESWTVKKAECQADESQAGINTAGRNNNNLRYLTFFPRSKCLLLSCIPRWNQDCLERYQ